jgi:hypothetical protein
MKVLFAFITHRSVIKSCCALKVTVFSLTTIKQTLTIALCFYFVGNIFVLATRHIPINTSSYDFNNSKHLEAQNIHNSCIFEELKYFSCLKQD